MTTTPKPIRECTRLACPSPPVGSRAQHCTECHAMFASPTAGDMHRVGEFPDGRRCLTTDEMLERGMRLNPRGWWLSPVRKGHSPHWQSGQKPPNRA